MVKLSEGILLCSLIARILHHESEWNKPDSGKFWSSGILLFVFYKFSSSAFSVDFNINIAVIVICTNLIFQITKIRNIITIPPRQELLKISQRTGGFDEEFLFSPYFTEKAKLLG